MRIVKYRGSTHATNEFPFLIEEDGISMLPITSVGLDHPAHEDRVGTGVPALDLMLGGGVYRGSSSLISGSAGTGKTSFAAQFAQAACSRGEHCLYFAFEESPSQLLRNMRSIGIELEPWIKQGLLTVHAVRPTLYGLESHLARMFKMTQTFKPQSAVIDPVTNFLAAGTGADVRSMLTRLIDLLKTQAITSLFTSLTFTGEYETQSETAVSSLMDTWLLLRDVEIDEERRGTISILKARGTAHSKRIRGFRLTGTGVMLTETEPR